MSKLSQDQFFLKLALNLAKKGLGWTYPNPMVGAVLVKNGKIIGQGYHKKFGSEHAEIEAFKSAKNNISGATLFVNLEPCVHFGKTPPCVPEIIRSKIKTVVCSTLDPNPLVSGKGLATLKQAGITVSAGLLKAEARKLNEAFFTFHEKKRPFVTIKFACSLDGKIATSTGDSRWITNDKARTFARHLRSQHQAILVGINTVLTDNPNLGVRIKNKKDPIRVILDPTLKIPLQADVLRDENALIVTTLGNQKAKLIQQRNIPLIIFPKNPISIKELLSQLWQRKIVSILVEGGSKILGSFIDEKQADKLYAFYAPIILGGESAITAVSGKGVERVADSIHLKNISFKKLDDNFLISGYI